MYKVSQNLLALKNQHLKVIYVAQDGRNETCILTYVSYFGVAIWRFTFNYIDGKLAKKACDN